MVSLSLAQREKTVGSLKKEVKLLKELVLKNANSSKSEHKSTANKKRKKKNKEIIDSHFLDASMKKNSESESSSLCSDSGLDLDPDLLDASEGFPNDPSGGDCFNGEEKKSSYYVSKTLIFNSQHSINNAYEFRESDSEKNDMGRSGGYVS